jgi:hypothetical protein
MSSRRTPGWKPSAVNAAAALSTKKLKYLNQASMPRLPARLSTRSFRRWRGQRTIARPAV